MVFLVYNLFDCRLCKLKLEKNEKNMEKSHWACMSGSLNICSNSVMVSCPSPAGSALQLLISGGTKMRHSGNRFPKFQSLVQLLWSRIFVTIPFTNHAATRPAIEDVGRKFTEGFLYGSWFPLVRLILVIKIAHVKSADRVDPIVSLRCPTCTKCC